ncbi:MAG TPA: UDP-N-acetylmuramate--L-alanine ligase [Candidatus Limnocylindria bacterium]|nr:UDP-N-acetylmuramate--L-alanine ligase [Candidatus Limnocylindria bacterium]
MTFVTGPGRRVHFVGIGGIGMSGIAEVLLTLGYAVSGSDLVESETTRRLVQLGARVHIGPHDAAHVDADVDVLVISSAVTYANPEVVRARDLRIPVIPRAEMLAELMRMKQGVAVAGTHGKTTTTSLIGAVLYQAGRDPTVVVGGRLRGDGTNARIGQGSMMVVEADESDGTFLLLSPIIAVVTNIDPEHLDHFGDLERVREAYRQFVQRVPFYGLAVLCIDNVNVRAMLPQVNKRFVTYGTVPDAEWQARDLRVDKLRTSFELWRREQPLGTVHLQIPGRHNALNALAAFAVADELGIPWRIVAHALSEFGGVHRRFEVRGEEQDVLVVDDYGHHPEEIRATLLAAREGFGRRLVVAFQPHRYSRTRDLFAEFLSAFDDAAVVLLTDIYPAGEDKIDGVSSEALYQALKKRGHLDVRHVPERGALAEALLEVVQPGDLVVTLGAGDVYRTADELLALLRSGHAPRQLH